MANHCENKLTIKFKKEKHVKLFKESIYNKDGNVDFSILIPDTVNDNQDIIKHVELRGCKWSTPYYFEILEKGNKFKMGFSTPRSPPSKRVKKIVEEFKDIIEYLRLDYIESGQQFAGYINYQNGELIEKDIEYLPTCDFCGKQGHRIYDEEEEECLCPDCI